MEAHDRTPLLEPITLHDLQLANRVAMAPMTRGRAGPERCPNDVMADYYTQRASVGLIITEATTISEQANGWNQSPGIYTDEMTEGWKRVSHAVHRADGRLFMQLWHCGRASHSSFTDDALPVAPSPIAINGDGVHTPSGKQPHETPRALDADELPGIVDDYARAAERAKQAGVDGVEIHAANGYLLDTFLQSKTNHRTDGYGGSIEHRFRLLREVVGAVASVWPSNRVGVRLSPNGAFNDMGSQDFREQFLGTAAMLNEFNLSYLHVMDGLAFGFHELGDPITLAEARLAFNGPIIGNCGYTQSTASAAVERGDADLIAIGRPLIANPDLVRRYREGLTLAEDAPVDDWYTPKGAEGYTDFALAP